MAEIVADSGLTGKVGPETWGKAMAVMLPHVAKGHVGEGLSAAVERIGLVLATHFPKTAADTNELPDRRSRYDRSPYGRPPRNPGRGAGVFSRCASAAPGNMPTDRATFAPPSSSRSRTAISCWSSSSAFAGRAVPGNACRLIGDETEGEAVLDGAARELEEETGYRPAGSSAGGILFLAGHDVGAIHFGSGTGLEKVGDGGGDSDEQIVVHG